jgi:hypothetical protein
VLPGLNFAPQSTRRSEQAVSAFQCHIKKKIPTTARVFEKLLSVIKEIVFLVRSDTDDD